jgi:hypothetical protein
MGGFLMFIAGDTYGYYCFEKLMINQHVSLFNSKNYKW